MNYWWVNHKQTFRQEFGGRYVWCPKRRSDGHIHHFYETVREVRPGDLVLSYANAAVQESRKGVCPSFHAFITRVPKRGLSKFSCFYHKRLIMSILIKFITLINLSKTDKYADNPAQLDTAYVRSSTLIEILF